MRRESRTTRRMWMRRIHIMGRKRGRDPTEEEAVGMEGGEEGGVFGEVGDRGGRVVRVVLTMAGLVVFVGCAVGDGVCGAGLLWCVCGGAAVRFGAGTRGWRRAAGAAAASHVRLVMRGRR